MGGFAIFLLVVLVILFAAGVVAFLAGGKGLGGLLGGVSIAGVILLFTLGGLYTQDPGTAVVVKSVTGEVAGQTTKEGLQHKWPWDTADAYNTRNQQVIFAHHKGNEAQDNVNGPQITVQDAEGVSANIDITVRYSIDPDAVTDIYKRYGTEANFVSKFIENDIRAGVRTVPTQFTTLDLLTKGRVEAEKKIHDYLAERWEKAGVRVETVSLQEIRYSKDVQERFDQAQSARIEVQKAKAELETNKTKAESNRVLAKSLTGANLEQLKWETLREIGKNGNTIVVPENFGGIVNLPNN